MNNTEAVRLLAAASVLLLLSGCIFGFMGKWAFAALVWAGMFGCAVAALNFKNRKDD